ncbi:MAG TPA: M3 family metallopeptidase [Candidatus Paceibacterota bacterium]|nr:M3 family metallopeptidase [Verrucomicrobiota bacterium]HSA11086.1 M3 family metallopeptidase [Candidatus Paceibacterota bacterium]
MYWKCALFALLALLVTALAGMAQPTNQIDRLKEFKKRAAAFKSVITLPLFETTSNAIRFELRQTIAVGNAALDRLGALQPREVKFENTVRALDDINYQVSLTADRFGLIKETSTRAALRNAATEALKELQEWTVGLDYREDVYRAIKAYADRKPRLKVEEAKLLAETMRDYRRAGLDLPKPERDEVERLRKSLTRLMTDFESNINKARKTVKFTRAELEGVPDSFLAQAKSGDDEYTVKVNVTWHYQSVMENARREATRKRLLLSRDNLARTENLPLLEKILPLRDDIARKLGYPSWADYQTEIKMARNAAAVVDFLEKLKTGLQPKFDAELAEFRRIKARETGDPNAQVHIWDWRYLNNQLKKEKYNVDAEQLRVFFPYERVLDGMFKIYQTIFGLKFDPVQPPYKWVDDLQLYAVSDAQTGEPLGVFYLDMFPREGKYNHFAHFRLVQGKLLASGKYQRPTVALICNFPSPTKDKPSLLSHSDVETIFHEFGHAMHSMMTRASYARFAGTSVPGDFVEAPSQMLENWVWDKKVLDSFAADYRDPSRKIPADILAQLKAAKLATEGTRYRRQLAFGLTDMALHTQIHTSNATNALPLSNKVLGEVFLPMAPKTAFVAYFGHLMGYDAGYYGYAWADAIAADMATVFERSPNGYFDSAAGRRLRDEIYAPGDSRDANVSIEEFLGRPRSLEPFLRKLGIEK